MRHRIIGSTMPILEVTLTQGERVYAESGELAWLSPTIQMQTSTGAGDQPGGSLVALGRSLSGTSFFMTEYTSEGGTGLVAFAAKTPGQILPVEVGASHYMVHRRGFMCAVPGVRIGTGILKRLGVLAGQGFVMQKLTGQGQAFVELYGEVVVYDLAAHETIRCHPGHCGMFQHSVTHSITAIPGVKNKLFGGDGLFLLKLTGPGKVWLQSLRQPMSHAIPQME